MESSGTTGNNFSYKEIFIGDLIKKRINDLKIDSRTICKYVCCTEYELLNIFKRKSIDTDILLKFCKILKYDFFRLYNQHLILYSPKSSSTRKIAQIKKEKTSTLPSFRKSIYTIEIINFILERLEKNEMTISEVILQYKIPKTTLYKWISKYQKYKTT